MSATPIKRAPELQYLSHQHHQVLIVCWKIRAGLAKPGAIASLQKFVIYFYQHYLLPHFAEEEAHLYPLLGNDHPLIQQALAEHRQLQQILDNLSQAPEQYTLLEHLLTQHIRFEERVLFNEIQQQATPEQLQAIAAADTGTDKGFVSIEQWEDKFWE